MVQLVFTIAGALCATLVVFQDSGAAQNKALVRRVFTDLLTAGRYEAASDIYARDFVNHGPKDLRYDENIADIRGWRQAFPDLEMIVDNEVAEGDFVTVLWHGRGTNTGSGNGLNATGKRAEGRGISVFRVHDGRIREEWTEYSGVSLMRQLGLLPS